MRPRQTLRGPNRWSKKQLYTLCTSLVVFFVLSVIGLMTSIPTVLAMEQQARCGLEEHVHTDDCYLNNIIICQQKAHTHSDNCYLLLLEDNDINMLLTQVSKTDDKNLETLIAGVLGEAVRLNELGEEEPVEEDKGIFSFLSNDTRTASAEPVLATSFSGTTYAGTEVSQLNDVIETYDVQPAVVLNEGLAVPATMALDETEEDTSNSGIATIAEENTNYNGANIYIKVGDKWTLLETTTFTYVSSSNQSWYSYKGITTSSLDSLIQQQTGLTSYTLKYASSSSSSSWSNTGTLTRNGTTYTTFGSYSSDPIYIRVYDASGDEVTFHAVTLQYKDKSGNLLNTETKYVVSGNTVSLDAGYTWQTEDGTAVDTNTPTINSTITYVGIKEVTVAVEYDINFSTVSGVTFSTEPTIVGTGTQTYTDTYKEAATNITIRNVSSQEVFSEEIQDNTADGLCRVAYFVGWQISGTDTILSANTKLTWEELQAYDDDGDGVVELVGVWEYEAYQTAAFYIRLDSVAVDTEGNITSTESKANYTNVLFSTHVGGVDTSVGNLTNYYGIADTTSDNSYGADQEIRALYGKKATGVWLHSFPDDDDMFAAIKADVQADTTKKLTVDGVAVDLDQLNSNYYAIRWFVFKYEGDAWHIDGKLVKKEGVIDVTKTFAGNSTLIESAKEGFYITAQNADGSKYYVLTLETLTETQQKAHVAYREGAEFLTPVDDEDGNSNTYLWQITDVTHAEVWTITEYTKDLDNATEHSEWTVVDSTNSQTGATAGTGNTLSVTGVTHATDVENNEYLRAGFNNIYYRNDTLMLKKEDKRTGQALAGAEFQLYQNGQLMTFNYDAEDGLYVFDLEGDGEVDTLTCDGYVNISIENISYDKGNITIKEVTAPAGYNAIGETIIGNMVDTNNDGTLDAPGIVNIVESEGYAEFLDGLLIIKNSSDPIDVTAQKIWNCDEADRADVTIELLANGSINLASQLITEAGVLPTVVLNAANNYTYTWNDLPGFANGVGVTWTIREIKIGSEDCKSDYSFANWINSYSSRTDTDGNIHLTVTNTPHRPLLYLTKTDWSELLTLAGAKFRIVEVDEDGTEVGVAKELTTDENGKLLFDNLKYETRYKLTETEAPEGYWPFADAVYLQIAQDGAVTLESDNGYVSAGNLAYNIQVKNRTSQPMPETGGSGTIGFTCAGLMLMAGVFTYHKNLKKCNRKRRRGARRSTR